MKTIAFFDFDGTITTDDTFITFGKFALGRTGFAIRIIMASPWLALWKLRIISNSRAKQTLFRFMFKGMDRGIFLRLCDDFTPHIDKSLRTETMRSLIEHQDRGDRVVIVSASIKDWIEPWAKLHNVRDVIATEVEYDTNGRLTGRFSTPNCHGLEKACRIIGRFGDISAIDTYAYGDSKGDEAMLELAKHPVRIRKVLKKC